MEHQYLPIPDDVEEIGTKVLDCAFAVHRTLGPGLLEGVYEECMMYELSKRNLAFQSQLELPIHYDGILLKNPLKIDLIVEDSVIVELKSVEQLLPVHQAQLMTYLRLSEKRLGFLLNFNRIVLKDGMKRIVM